MNFLYKKIIVFLLPLFFLQSAFCQTSYNDYLGSYKLKLSVWRYYYLQISADSLSFTYVHEKLVATNDTDATVKTPLENEPILIHFANKTYGVLFKTNGLDKSILLYPADRNKWDTLRLFQYLKTTKNGKVIWEIAPDKWYKKEAGRHKKYILCNYDTTNKEAYPDDITSVTHYKNNLKNGKEIIFYTESEAYNYEIESKIGGELVYNVKEILKWRRGKIRRIMKQYKPFERTIFTDKFVDSNTGGFNYMMTNP